VLLLIIGDNHQTAGPADLVTVKYIDEE